MWPPGTYPAGFAPVFPSRLLGLLRVSEISILFACLHLHMLFPCWKHPSLTCELSVESGVWVPADGLHLPLYPTPPCRWGLSVHAVAWSLALSWGSSAKHAG